MFYSENGWDPFLQSELGTRRLCRTPPQQPEWESGGSPHLRERSSSGLDLGKPEQRMILPHFSFPRRPWGRLHGRDRYYLGAYPSRAALVMAHLSGITNH